MDVLTAALYVLFERREQATDETDLEVRQNTPLRPRRFSTLFSAFYLMKH